LAGDRHCSSSSSLFETVGSTGMICTSHCLVLRMRSKSSGWFVRGSHKTYDLLREQKLDTSGEWWTMRRGSHSRSSCSSRRTTSVSSAEHGKIGLVVLWDMFVQILGIGRIIVPARNVVRVSSMFFFSLYAQVDLADLVLQSSQILFG